jgi:small subunit ribosomal protein S16
LEEAGIEMPKWVKKPAQKTRAIKNAEKLRRNQPKEEVAEVTEEAEA